MPSKFMNIGPTNPWLLPGNTFQTATVSERQCDMTVIANPQFVTTPQIGCCAFGDIDGDGREEILSSSVDGLSLGIFSWFSLGDLAAVTIANPLDQLVTQWRGRNTLPPAPAWTLNPNDRFFCIDLDGDGNDEVVIYNSAFCGILKWTGSQLELLIAMETPTTQPANLFVPALKVPGLPTSAIVAFTVPASPSSNQPVQTGIYSNTATGPSVAYSYQNGPALNYQSDAGAGAPVPNSFFFADIDGDGYQELIVHNFAAASPGSGPQTFIGIYRQADLKSPFVRLWSSGGAGTSPPSSAYTGPAGPSFLPFATIYPGYDCNTASFSFGDTVMAGDLDGDGAMELIVNGIVGSTPCTRVYKYENASGAALNCVAAVCPSWTGPSLPSQYTCGVNMTIAKSAVWKSDMLIALSQPVPAGGSYEAQPISVLAYHLVKNSDGSFAFPFAVSPTNASAIPINTIVSFAAYHVSLDLNGDGNGEVVMNVQANFLNVLTIEPAAVALLGAPTNLIPGWNYDLLLNAPANPFPAFQDGQLTAYQSISTQVDPNTGGDIRFEYTSTSYAYYKNFTELYTRLQTISKPADISQADWDVVYARIGAELLAVDSVQDFNTIQDYYNQRDTACHTDALANAVANVNLTQKVKPDDQVSYWWPQVIMGAVWAIAAIGFPELEGLSDIANAVIGSGVGAAASFGASIFGSALSQQAAAGNKADQQVSYVDFAKMVDNQYESMSTQTGANLKKVLTDSVLLVPLGSLLGGTATNKAWVIGNDDIDSLMNIKRPVDTIIYYSLLVPLRFNMIVWNQAPSGLFAPLKPWFSDYTGSGSYDITYPDYPTQAWWGDPSSKIIYLLCYGTDGRNIKVFPDPALMTDILTNLSVQPDSFFTGGAPWNRISRISFDPVDMHGG